ncbi:MAG TPA: alpha/beta hydrolase family protein [Candidatus Limnocylindrales bacterium]|nr:alpha/beta hydrolase family protein [Candidatus Limnocylindrales bacterium]
MARLRCDFFADTLGLSTTMTVLLPQPNAQIGVHAGAIATEPPTLYLLHGLSDDDTAWTRYTSIERYAAELGLAVVMPQVHRSFYADEAQGHRYWTFLSEELPAIVHRFFKLSPRREDTFVAGLSMGGYGAFKWALRQPQRFAAAASLSGVLDIAERAQAPRSDDDTRMFQRIFGEAPLTGTINDLNWLIEQAAETPHLYVCCGTEDVLHPGNLTFIDACRAKNIAVTTDFGPGEHDWTYWDARIRDVLAWLQVVRR